MKNARNHTFRLGAALFSLLLIFSFSTYKLMRPAAATGTVTQDGITLSVTTDKDSYDAGETVDITASLTSENKNLDGTLTVPAEAAWEIVYVLRPSVVLDPH